MNVLLYNQRFKGIGRKRVNGSISHLLLQPYSRIDQAVHEIDQDDHEDQKSSVKNGCAHNDRVVELLYCLYELAAKAGYGEDDLNHEATGSDRSDRRSEYGNDRQDGISQLVARKYLTRGHALGFGCANKV